MSTHDRNNIYWHWKARKGTESVAYLCPNKRIEPLVLNSLRVFAALALRHVLRSGAALARHLGADLFGDGAYGGSPLFDRFDFFCRAFVENFFGSKNSVPIDVQHFRGL